MYEIENEKVKKFVEKNDITLDYDYQQYMDQVSSKINDYFIETLNFACIYYFDVEDLIIKKIKEDVDSPREYNYSTDRAFFTVEMNEDKYHKVIDLVFDKFWDSLKKAIKKRFTSRPGFTSFYSNDIEDWYNKKYDFDHNELSTIFGLIVREYEDQDNIEEKLFEISSEVFYSLDLKYELFKDGKTQILTYKELEKISY